MHININLSHKNNKPYRENWAFEYTDPNEWKSVYRGYESHRVRTLPLMGKKAVLSSYQNTVVGYSSGLIEAMGDKLNGAQCGLYMAQNGICVVDLDCDDADFLTHALDLFGYTPVMVKTHRGYHLYYRNLEKAPARQGRNIDLKAGAAGYVVAPLSYHADGGRYELCGPKFSELNDNEALDRFCQLIRSDELPEINWQDGQVIFGTNQGRKKTVEAVTEPQTHKISNTRKKTQTAMSANVVSFNGKIKQGSRNAFLWRQGLLIAADVGAIHDVILSRLYGLNFERCDPPCSQAEVNGVAQWAYDIQRKGQNISARNTTRKEFHDVTLSRRERDILKGRPLELAVYMELKGLNLPQGKFALMPEFVNRATGRKCKNGSLRAQMKRSLLSLGMIKQVQKYKKGMRVDLFAFNDVLPVEIQNPVVSEKEAKRA